MKNLKVTHSKTWTFFLTGESVTVEWSNTSRHFAWRLKIGNCQTGEWESYYTGITHIKSNKTGAVYAVLTQYWYDGILPVEEPFLVGTVETINKSYEKEKAK